MLLQHNALFLTLFCKMSQRQLRGEKKVIHCKLMSWINALFSASLFEANWCSWNKFIPRTLLLRLSFPGLSCIRCFPHKSSLIVLGPKLVFNDRLRSSMQVTTFEPRQNPHARSMIYDRPLDDVTRVSPAFFPNKVNKLLIYSSKNVLLLSLTGAH